MASSPPLKILITGGARGIGRGLFRNFLSAGHSVYILDSNTEELDWVRGKAGTWAQSQKGSWKATHCDLADRTRIAEVVTDVEEVFEGKLDVLINNAFATPHIWSDDLAMDAPGDTIMREWDTKIAVGLTAPFLLSRLCLPLLRCGSSCSGSPGTIVNVSSTRAYQAEQNHEAYSAAKAGLLGLTRSMSVSLGGKNGVRVNAVVPGWIHVENENMAADKEERKWEEEITSEDAEWHPAGRVGKVEDVVKAVKYCVENGFVTGQDIVIDGGVGGKMVYPE